MDRRNFIMGLLAAAGAAPLLKRNRNSDPGGRRAVPGYPVWECPHSEPFYDHYEGPHAFGDLGTQIRKHDFDDRGSHTFLYRSEDGWVREGWHNSGQGWSI